jgi:hypothetical protein
MSPESAPTFFIIGTSNKDTWHTTRVFDLTYFWRSQRSKFKTAPLVCTFRFNLTQNITLWEHVARHHLCFYQISAQSDFKLTVIPMVQLIILVVLWLTPTPLFLWCVGGCGCAFGNGQGNVANQRMNHLGTFSFIHVVYRYRQIQDILPCHLICLEIVSDVGAIRRPVWNDDVSKNDHCYEEGRMKLVAEFWCYQTPS